MQINERQSEILALLEDREFITVPELCKKLYASPSTIRRDLTFLEQNGSLHKAYGGATSLQVDKAPAPFKLRTQDSSMIKKQLAKAAANMIEEGDFLFFDSSTSVAHIIPFLKKYNNLTIVTNSIENIIELGRLNKLQVYSTGGKIDLKNRAFIGNDVRTMVQQFHFDKMFFSAETILLKQHSIYDASRDHADLCQLVRQHTNSMILLAYEKKFKNIPRYWVCDMEDIDFLITDTEISAEYLSPKKVILVKTGVC